MQELFDLPEEYDSMLQKGIGITGNDKKFFIRGRLNHLFQTTPDLNKIKTILDFGCGTGESSFEFANRFPEAMVWGTDLSEKAVEFAMKTFRKENLHFVSPATPLPGSFDLVYLNCVIHHVPPAERKQVIQTLFSLCIPGSRIWIFENNPANPGTQWAMYANPFDKGVVKVWPGSLRSMMEAAGFTILQTDFLFYFPQWLSFLRPLEKFLLRLPLGGQYGILARR